jgi:cullin 1
MKTTHRKLTWIHSLGNVNMKGIFNKKPYDLMITTLQAVVLLAFNAPEGSTDDGIRSFELLTTITNLSEEVLKRVLHSLACGKYKVLKRLPPASTGAAASAPVSGAVKTTDVFQFNDSFTSPMRKVRIPMASLEENSNSKKVEEDRTLIIEAAIVRIMKARKTLQHQQLVAEVLTHLTFFKPDPKVVKRRIEALIDREYLEREAGTQNVYRYLA